MEKNNRGTVSVPEQVPYHRVLVSSKRRILRGILAILLLIGGMYFFAIAFSLIASEIDTRFFGRVNPAGGGTDNTPVFMASNFLAIAMLIPLSMLIQRWLYGVKGFTLHSVRSLFRPAVFGRALLLILPIWTVCMVIFNWYAPYTTTEWRIDDLLVFFAVSILIVPLQSAGEEYGFRGLIFRIASSWVRSPRASLIIGIIVSSVLFATIHLSNDLWSNLYFIATGVTLALMTWRTGGLEYAIVLHAVNNSLNFLILTIMRADPLIVVDRGEMVLIPIAILVLITIIVWRSTRHTGPALISQNSPNEKQINDNK